MSSLGNKNSRESGTLSSSSAGIIVVAVTVIIVILLQLCIVIISNARNHRIPHSPVTMHPSEGTQVNSNASCWMMMTQCWEGLGYCTEESREIKINQSWLKTPYTGITEPGVGTGALCGFGWQKLRIHAFCQTFTKLHILSEEYRRPSRNVKDFF